MKKSLILGMIGLMLGILSAGGANVTSSTENLVFGKMWMEGSLRAGIAQRLHIEVTNKGTETYQGFWSVLSPSCLGNSEDIILAAGETKDVEVDILFMQEGHYEVIIMDPIGKKLFTYTVDIAEFQAPRLKGEIRLDMLERTDDGNILYGDFANFRITGTATITNEDDYPYFGLGHIMIEGRYMGIVCSVWPWFSRIITTYEPFYGLAQEIKPGETITKDFLYEFVAYPEEDQEYGIQIKAAVQTETIGDITIASIPFKVRQCTNTYWTADKHVKPLPVSADQVLKVPYEALAVDLRGQYDMNTTFSIDVSEANPNCLYYLGFLDNVPQGLSKTQNVIRNYGAQSLIIDTNYDYFCPMPFKANLALFQYTPVSEAQGPAQPYMSMTLSGTLVLPFDATKAWLVDINDSPGIDAGFSGNNLAVARFTGIDEGLEGVEDIMYFDLVTDNHLNAYEPYLVFSLPSQVDFYAEDVTVPSTRPAVASGTHFDFIGHTTQVSTKKDDYQNVYPWYVDDSHFYRSDTEELIRPFTAKMYAKTPEAYDRLNAQWEYGGATKMDVISVSPVEKSTAVYSLSGQRVGTAEVNDGRLTVNGLRPGIYIVGGRKMVVK
jgi:hypothetical protein